GGGEAAVTGGVRVVGLQAGGGLFDRLSLVAFPPALRAQIVRALPPLTIGTFCQLIAQEQHLDPRVPALAALTEPQRTAIASMDRIRNIDPGVRGCAAG